MKHPEFEHLPIGETCTLPGTKYTGTGKEAELLPCGEPTVGAGMFCEPGHQDCEYNSICERHAP